PDYLLMPFLTQRCTLPWRQALFTRRGHQLHSPPAHERPASVHPSSVAGVLREPGYGSGAGTEYRANETSRVGKTKLLKDLPRYCFSCPFLLDHLMATKN